MTATFSHAAGLAEPSPVQDTATAAQAASQQSPLGPPVEAVPAAVLPVTTQEQPAHATAATTSQPLRAGPAPAPPPAQQQTLGLQLAAPESAGLDDDTPRMGFTSRRGRASRFILDSEDVDAGPTALPDDSAPVVPQPAAEPAEHSQPAAAAFGSHQPGSLPAAPEEQGAQDPGAGQHASQAGAAQHSAPAGQGAAVQGAGQRASQAAAPAGTPAETAPQPAPEPALSGGWKRRKKHAAAPSAEAHKPEKAGVHPEALISAFCLGLWCCLRISQLTLGVTQW